jgi:hypothetical protein
MGAWKLEYEILDSISNNVEMKIVLVAASLHHLVISKAILVL